MGKKVTGVTSDGKVVSWKARRVREVEFPTTSVATRAQRVKRALVG